jgi:hypothetical protein
MSTPRDVHVEAELPQGSVLSPTLCNWYINDTPQRSANVALCTDDTAFMRQTARKAVLLENSSAV